MSLQRFEGNTIEAVLEEARATVGPDVRVIEANRLRKGGLAGFFSKERFEVAVETGGSSTPVGATDAVLALADQVSDGELKNLSTEQGAFADLLGRMARDTKPVAVEAVEPAPAAPVPTAPAPVQTATPIATMPMVRREPATLPAVTGEPQALARLGVPRDLVPVDGDTAVGLLEAMRELPVAAPIPRAAGDVVVVVGERDQALTLARAIAEELGLSPDEVVLAAEDDHGIDLPVGCLLPTLPAVSDERCSARWRTRPTVVALVSPVRAGGSRFGRRALEALEPSATWGAVTAACKPEDVLGWADSLGGLDAVAVDGIDATASPASILCTGIPVARIDGRPASAALWTALLMERLAA